MESVLKFIGLLGEKVIIIGLLALVVLVVFGLEGCAVGRGPGGEIVLGVEAGKLMETAEQGLIAGAGMIPGIGPVLSNVLMGAVAGGATVKGSAAAAIRLIESKRRKSDMAREELRVDVADLKAKLESKEVVS